jgi:tetratricopeptide (TPR) repeat protein
MKRNITITTALLLNLLSFSIVYSGDLETADELFRSQQWDKVLEAYKKLAQQDQSSPLVWLRMGTAYQKLGDFPKAIDAFQQAGKKGASVPLVQLRLAETYAKMNQLDQGIEALQKATAAGITNVQSIVTNPDLASLRQDKRFGEILSEMQKNTTPCRNSPEFRQLDFWLGEWDVEANGQFAGTSSVQLILDDCVIFENWTSRGLSQGYSGKSFNVFNPALKKWEQLWVDNTGSVLTLQGEYKDGTLQYRGETPQADGTKTNERLTFFKLPDDRVHQVWEQSRDGGKSWQVIFDGLYKRKK